MAQEIPNWLNRALSMEDLAKIDAAVKRSEARTSAEIVPMIVHRSTLKSTGDRILFWICFGVLGVGGAVSLSLLGGLDSALLDRVIEAFGIWPTEALHFALSVLAELVVAMMAFAVAWGAARVLSHFDVAHRLVFPHSDMALEAEHRAQNEFYSSDLRSTTGQTGVLLFVSMLERRAVILADQAIVAKFAPETWTKTLDALLHSIGNGKMAEGYARAIEAIGEMLAPHFPLLADDKNELSDGLRIEE